MLLRVKVVTSDFEKFYVTISCHVYFRFLTYRAEIKLVRLLSFVSSSCQYDDGISIQLGLIKLINWRYASIHIISTLIKPKLKSFIVSEKNSTDS